MGRLFWKILLTFWLTLLITGGITGIAVWLHQNQSIYSAPSPVIEKIHRPPHRFPFGLLMTGVTASFISSFLLAWYFSQPIGILRKAFRAAAKGDLSQRVTATIGSRRDEIADLGRDFDDMATKLQILMASQRRLLHDVSHELRSPLARLQASIGLAHQQPEKVASSLARIEHEAGRLDTLVGEVLTLSRLESGVPQPLDEYIDILELADAVIDDARFEANALSRQVVFQCDVEDSPIIQGRGELLYRALENVVRNAIHHTPENTAVTLAIHHDAAASRLHLTVDDQGSGVPEAELGSIFEPFQRSSNASANRNGYGLGLAIARRAIESHGGTIRAKNLSSGGLRVEIYLPLTVTMQPG